MGVAGEYRRLAAEQRDAAASTDLPLVRSQYLNAAEKWDILAAEAELFEPRYVAQLKAQPQVLLVGGAPAPAQNQILAPITKLRSEVSSPSMRA